MRRLLSLWLLAGIWTSLACQDRTAWFREAKFGMFIHWGPYSLARVEASWPIMVPGSKRYPAISPDNIRECCLESMTRSRCAGGAPPRG